MSVSRSNMGKQVSTAPKKGGGLEMISPTAAAIKSIQSGEPTGLMKLVPAAQLLANKRKTPEDRRSVAASTPSPMAKGGKVRGDGCCMRGGTRGRTC